MYSFDQFRKDIPQKLLKHVVIPPPCFDFLSMEILYYHKEEQKLITKMPVKKPLLNPSSVVQGGFLTAMMDNTIGPLSFLVAKRPTTSLDMNTTYLRPATTNDEFLICEARLINQSKNYLFFHASVTNLKDKKQKAFVTSRMKILNELI